jgi:hypothetical protein
MLLYVSVHPAAEDQGLTIHRATLFVWWVLEKGTRTGDPGEEEWASQEEGAGWKRQDVWLYLVSCFSCHNPGTSHFFKTPWFLVAENGVENRI